MVMKLMNTLTLSIQTQFMGEYDDSLIGPLDDEGEVPSTIASDQWLLEYAIQDFEKHHKDKLKQYVKLQCQVFIGVYHSCMLLSAAHIRTGDPSLLGVGSTLAQATLY